MAVEKPIIVRVIHIIVDPRGEPGAIAGFVTGMQNITERPTKENPRPEPRYKLFIDACAN